MTKYFTNTCSILTSNRILYTPSSFTRSSLFYLQEIGGLKANCPHVSSRNNLHLYLFFTVVSGMGKFTFREKEYKLLPGECVFIDYIFSYAHATDSGDLWRIKWIHFNGTKMAKTHNLNIYEYLKYLLVKHPDKSWSDE